MSGFITRRSGLYGSRLINAETSEIAVRKLVAKQTDHGSEHRRAAERAIYAEVNARQQIQALMLGTPVTYLGREEARHASATVPNDPHRAWNLWRRQARGIRARTLSR